MTDVLAALEEHLQFARLTRNFLDHDLWRAAGFQVHVLGAGQDKTGEAGLVALGAQQGGWYNGVGGEGHGE